MSLERSSFTCKLLWCKNFWWRYNSFWRLPIIIKGYLPRGLLHFLVFMLKYPVQKNHIKIFNRLKKFFFAVFRWNEIAMPLTWTFSILHCLITFFAIPTCKSSSFLLCNCVQSLLYFTRPSTEKTILSRLDALNGK